MTTVNYFRLCVGFLFSSKVLDLGFNLKEKHHSVFFFLFHWFDLHFKEIVYVFRHHFLEIFCCMRKKRSLYELL